MQPIKYKIKLPFQNLDMRAWQNLALTGLIVIYIAQIVMRLIIEGPIAVSLGTDFRAFWSSGYIANTYGYDKVYNLDILGQVQKQMVQQSTSIVEVEITPVPFLPIFITIFQVFALFPAVPSFYTWFFLSLIGFYLYLCFFLNKMGVKDWKRLALIGLLAFPSFSNLFWGQINLLLFICIGEFIRNFSDHHDFRSGLWLGVLILKPQLLILIGPALLLQKKWKILGGFIITIFITIIVSLILGGSSSLINLTLLIIKYIPGIATNAQENMMNWRMLGERLSIFFPAEISWGITSFGMVGTIIATFLLWRKPLISSSQNFLIAFFGTLAATMAITWHSHVHMAMILIPPLIYFNDKNLLPSRLFNWWIFGVPLIILILPLPLKLLNLDQNNTLPGLTGFIFLIFNLIFVVWAMKSLRSS